MSTTSINIDSILEPAQAAAIIGVSVRRVYQFCEEGRLGVKIGSRYLITRQQAKNFKLNKPGRPKQA